jgi:hypothetical protein
LVILLSLTLEGLEFPELVGIKDFPNPESIQELDTAFARARQDDFPSFIEPYVPERAFTQVGWGFWELYDG